MNEPTSERTHANEATFFSPKCYPCMMRNVLLLPLFAGFLLVNGMKAQVSVYGFYNTYSDPSNPIVLGQFEAISGEWLEWDTLEFASGVVMGSSAFDAGTESFMFAGIGSAPGNAIQFWDYDVIDNEILNNPNFYQTINAIQHDMATDRLLALGTYAEDSTFIDFGNGTGYWEYEWGSELIELNPTESAVTSIAAIEGINGVILGATAFDSDNDIYALVGIDYSGNQKFIQLDGTTGEVISSVNLQIPSNMGFNELECFISGETFLGIKRPYGINPNAETTALVSVNPLTGELTNLVELPQIYAFSPNASVFEQTTGLFIMLYYDFNNQSHILVVDPVEAEVVADHQINGSFIELQINNREFMVAAYGNASSIPEATAEAATWHLWPNPATETVRMQAVAAPYQVYDATGQVVQPWSNDAEIDVRYWPLGTYIAVQANGRIARFNVVH